MTPNPMRDVFALAIHRWECLDDCDKVMAANYELADVLLALPVMNNLRNIAALHLVAFGSGLRPEVVAWTEPDLGQIVHQGGSGGVLS